MTSYGPKTRAGDNMHALKYRQRGEDFREAMNRVAFGLKDSDSHYHEFREVLLDMRFLPGGRVQSSIGSGREVCSHNCFVSGTILDSFVHGDGSIMQRAHEAATTMRQGGGIGYDFSTLRPRGDMIRKLQSSSSGPVSFMRIFNEVGLCTASSGHRRGAQMAVLRVDHPDIEEFIRCKQNTDQLTGFNVSVAITDEFMEALAAKKSFDLKFGGNVYSTVDAEDLWEKIMRSTWDWAEPGVMFIDRVNEYNNLWYCEKIVTTNPCAEQPLPPFGACLLGSFNLIKYLIKYPQGYGFDFDRLAADVPVVVRAMDNVVDRARYPLPQQRAEAITKRRMGLGVTALANAGEALGYPYGSIAFLAFESEVLMTILHASYAASAILAKEKGSFPLFDMEKYLAGKFVSTLPEEIRALIVKYGIRNSHLTSIAPTGTISMAADNVSSGLEPVIYHAAERRINTSEGQETVVVEDYGVASLGVRGRLAEEVSAVEHVDVLTVAQGYVDSSVSKTVNCDGAMPWNDFKDIYQRAYDRGAKGCTTYNKDGRRGSIMSAAPEKKPEGVQFVEGGTCERDPVTGRTDCN